MNAEQWAANFRNKTHTEPRPSRSQERFANANEYEWAARDLQAAQDGYDQAKESDARMLQLRAEAVAKRAEAEAATRAQAAERARVQREAADEKILTPARIAFRAAGGTDAEFEQHRSEILEQARFNAAVQAAQGVAADMQPQSNPIHI